MDTGIYEALLRMAKRLQSVSQLKVFGRFFMLLLFDMIRFDSFVPGWLLDSLIVQGWGCRAGWVYKTWSIIIMQREVVFACGCMVLVWFGTVCGVRYGERKGNGERRHVHALRWLRKLW